MVKMDDFRELVAGIKSAAAHRFTGNDEAAQVYLAFITRADPERQSELFALVLANHGIRFRTERRIISLFDSINYKEWKHRVSKLKDVVQNWVDEVVRANASLPDTANVLWRKLRLYKGNNRVVAFGMLLDTKRIVPYAQLPEDPTSEQYWKVYAEAHNNILPYLALLSRAENDPTITISRLARTIVTMLRGMGDIYEQLALMSHFLHNVAAEIKQGHAAEDLMAQLSDGIFGALNREDDE